MKIAFAKYHALENDFLVLEAARCRVSRRRLPSLARAVCDRRRGVGADGIVLLSSSRKADRKFDIYNSDGGWAEKSGNGLRIAGLHLAMGSRRKSISFETANSIDTVRVGRKTKDGYIVSGEIGQPEFRTPLIPVKTRHKFLINTPLKVGGVTLPITCVAVGNPHAVIVVDDFDFDWQTLGAEIETSKPFPNHVNVEFVKVLSRRKLQASSWERGAGPTGSSGTGAAASVAAMVMLGVVGRKCDVAFRAGTLSVHWSADTDIITVTGPVVPVMEGVFEFK